MSKKTPKVEPSPLYSGHRWIWVPILTAVGLQVAVDLLLFFLR